jgi:hypothetical protein
MLGVGWVVWHRIPQFPHLEFVSYGTANHDRRRNQLSGGTATCPVRVQNWWQVPQSAPLGVGWVVWHRIPQFPHLEFVSSFPCTGHKGGVGR